MTTRRRARRRDTALGRPINIPGVGPTDLSIIPSWAWVLIAGGLAMQLFVFSTAGRKLAVKAWNFFKRPTTTNLRDTDIWTATIAPIQNAASQRAAVMLESVIDQFEVAANPRYTPRKTEPTASKLSTFCNIFVQDVLRALGLEVPWGNANALVDWYQSASGTAGWSRVSASAAISSAEKGKPTVAVWKNPDASAPGHVAIVRPGKSANSNPMIAQAGGSNFSNKALSNGFGKYADQVTFYTHA